VIPSNRSDRRYHSGKTHQNSLPCGVPAGEEFAVYLPEEVRRYIPYNGLTDLYSSTNPVYQQDRGPVPTERTT